MVLHGLLHPLAVANAWRPGASGYISSKLLEFSVSRSQLSLFLAVLAAVLFITAVTCCMLQRYRYWMPALVSILLLQTIVFMHWQAARYFTTANIILLAAVILSAAAMRFKAAIRKEVKDLLSRASKEILTTEETLRPLPHIVQRWMIKSGVVGNAMPNKIVISQKGHIRTKLKGSWMRFQATQHFTINPPGFVWLAAIKGAPFITIAGRDKYSDGLGNMIVRPFCWFNVVNNSGKEIDEGTLLRYVAAMVWFPQGAGSKYLRWESINDRQARVTMEYKGMTASGIYFFNEDADVIGFEAKRYGDFDGIYRKETWSVRITGFAHFGSTRIGNRIEVTWKLPEGDFHWLTVEVTGIHEVE